MQNKNKIITALLSCLLLSCSKENKISNYELSNSIQDSTVTVPSHVTFVWLENHNYNSIVGNIVDAPYINSLISQGTLLTNYDANGHPSKPNYVMFYSGDNQGVTNDNCTSTSQRFTTANLYTVLNAVGISCYNYSEDLPSKGYKGCPSGDYVQKHNAAACFKNVPAKANLQFTAFNNTINYSKNATVSIVAPNLQHDMHNGSIKQGDDWIRDSIGNVVNYSMTNNGIVVILFDENENHQVENKVMCLIVGEHVKQNFQLSNAYNHYSWTKTLASWYGADTAFTTNVANADVINGFWQ